MRSKKAATLALQMLQLLQKVKQKKASQTSSLTMYELDAGFPPRFATPLLLRLTGLPRESSEEKGNTFERTSQQECFFKDLREGSQVQGNSRRRRLKAR